MSGLTYFPYKKFPNCDNETLEEKREKLIESLPRFYGLMTLADYEILPGLIGIKGKIKVKESFGAIEVTFRRPIFARIVSFFVPRKKIETLEKLQLFIMENKIVGIKVDLILK